MLVLSSKSSGTEFQALPATIVADRRNVVNRSFAIINELAHTEGAWHDDVGVWP